MFPEIPSFKGFGGIDVPKTAVSGACGPRNTVKPLKNTCFWTDWNYKRLGSRSPPLDPPQQVDQGAGLRRRTLRTTDPKIDV
eukprot:2995558-Amphidinium_carterae.1